jgi:hypothetical protein
MWIYAKKPVMTSDDWLATGLDERLVDEPLSPHRNQLMKVAVQFMTIMEDVWTGCSCG